MTFPFFVFSPASLKQIFYSIESTQNLGRMPARQFLFW